MTAVTLVRTSLLKKCVTKGTAKTTLTKAKVSSSHQSPDITVLLSQHAMTTVPSKYLQSVMLDVLLIYGHTVTQIIMIHVCWEELRILVPIVPKKNYS